MNKIVTFGALIIASVLLYVSCTMSVQAMYPPDGTTHIVYTHGLIEYQVPQKDLYSNKQMKCQYFIYNINSQHYDHNVTIQLVTDHLTPAINKTFYPGNNNTGIFYSSVYDLQDAVFHFMISPSTYNDNPKFGLKCWIMDV